MRSQTARTRGWRSSMRRPYRHLPTTGIGITGSPRKLREGGGTTGIVSYVMTLSDGTPSRIGPYQLRQRVGEGGMGVVHLATDPEGRQVALKLLRPSVAAEDTARRRLAREVETMRRVQSPNVAAVIDADVVGPTPYVATQFIPGRTLEEIISTEGPLRGDALTRLAARLGGALGAIHSAGVVHRDLKPGNVIMHDGNPVVIDFGIAQAADTTRLTATGLFMGTPGYLAPEVINGEDPSPASDVHSWAATVAYAATGRPPFGAGTFEVIFFKILQGDADLGGVPMPLLPLLQQAFSRDPRLRPTALDAGGKAATLRLDGAPLAQSGTAVLPSGGTAQYSSPEDYADLLTPVRYAPTRAPEPDPAQLPPLQLEYDRYRRQGPPPPQGPPPQRPPYQERVAGGPPQQPPPPPPVRSRPFLGLLLFLSLVGLTLVLPTIGVITAVLGAAVLRAADRALETLSDRRALRGPSSGDLLRVVAGVPLGLIGGILGTLMWMPVNAILALVITIVLTISTTAGPATLATYAVAAFAALTVAGPGARKVRRSASRALAGIAGGPSGGPVGALALGLLALIMLSAGLTQAPSWAPLEQPRAPDFSFNAPELPSPSDWFEGELEKRLREIVRELPLA
ncbi:MAG: protein kinase [Streptosporangiales bacterium]|nr:protein kinase [Streptosporangiales bacterium]